MSFVQLTLVGNIGRDSELKFLPSGQAVCNFSLATTRRWNQGNEKKEETTWFRVAIFGQTAESLSQYLVKGKTVLVIADRIKADTYTGQDGQTRVNLDVTAKEVRLLGGGNGNGQQHRDDDAPYTGPADVDDIPF